MLNFIDQYLQTGNATKSAIAAGYSETSAHTTGCRLLKNALVRASIDDARVKQRNEHGVSAAWVIGKLKQVAEDTEARHADKIAASVAIGKHLNMFSDRKVASLTASHSDNVVHALVQRSTSSERAAQQQRRDRRHQGGMHIILTTHVNAYRVMNRSEF